MELVIPREPGRAPAPPHGSHGRRARGSECVHGRGTVSGPHSSSPAAPGHQPRGKGPEGARRDTSMCPWPTQAAGSRHPPLPHQAGLVQPAGVPGGDQQLWLSCLPGLLAWQALAQGILCLYWKALVPAEHREPGTGAAGHRHLLPLGQGCFWEAKPVLILREHGAEPLLCSNMAKHMCASWLGAQCESSGGEVGIQGCRRFLVGIGALLGAAPSLEKPKHGQRPDTIPGDGWNRAPCQGRKGQMNAVWPP